MMQLLFLIVAAVGLLSALGTVLAKNLVHAALFLIGFFFSIACQFVLLEAEFLAAMQVLVYIGAVSILILFGIMLTRNIQGDETTSGHWIWKLPAGVVAFGLLFVLLFGINRERGRTGQTPWVETSVRPGGVNPSVGGLEPLQLEIAPTEQYVATLDRDQRVRLWSPSDGREVAALHDPKRKLNRLGYSPDGRLVAASSDRGALTVWNVDSRRIALELESPAAAVASVAIGPRAPGSNDPLDRPYAIGTAEGTLHIWKGPEHDRLDIEAADWPIAALFFQNAESLFSATEDGAIFRWDLAGGESKLVRPAQDDRDTLFVRFRPPPEPAPDADSTEADEDTQGEAADPDSEPEAVPDGPLVAIAQSAPYGSGAGWQLLVLDGEDGEQRWSLTDQPGRIEALALSIDGAYIGTVTSPRTEAAEEEDELALAELGLEQDEQVAPMLTIRELGLMPSDEDEAHPGPEVFEASLDGRIEEASGLALGETGRRVAVSGAPATILFYDSRMRRWETPKGWSVASGSAIANMPRYVGDELMTRFVVPFELAGLLLTAALVGAIVLARLDPEDPGASPTLSRAFFATAPRPSVGQGDGDGRPAAPPRPDSEQPEPSSPTSPAP